MADRQQNQRGKQLHGLLCVFLEQVARSISTIIGHQTAISGQKTGEKVRKKQLHGLDWEDTSQTGREVGLDPPEYGDVQVCGVPISGLERQAANKGSEVQVPRRARRRTKACSSATSCAPPTLKSIAFCCSFLYDVMPCHPISRFALPLFPSCYQF